jgi:glutathione peroxidase
MANARDFEFTGLDGRPLKLARFKGKAVLAVNAASERGFTPRDAGLQKLRAAHKGRGLVVRGVPSNDSGAQEPGDGAAIAGFCAARYGIDFPPTAKQRAIGTEAQPFYRRIAEELGEAGSSRWNFHKYLIGRAGAATGA